MWKKYNIASTVQTATWLPKFLHLDEVKHNHIVRENGDIWSCLQASTAIFGHRGVHLFSCYISWHNASMRAGDV